MSVLRPIMFAGFFLGMGVMGFCARLVPAPTGTLVLMFVAGAFFLADGIYEHKKSRALSTKEKLRTAADRVEGESL